MAHSKNQNIDKLFRAYSARSTRKTRELAHQFNMPENFYGAKKGKQAFSLNIGQKVISTGTGQIKSGIELVIEDRWVQNGYTRYLAGGVIHQENDLSAI